MGREGLPVDSRQIHYPPTHAGPVAILGGCSLTRLPSCCLSLEGPSVSTCGELDWFQASLVILHNCTSFSWDFMILSETPDSLGREGGRTVLEGRGQPGLTWVIRGKPPQLLSLPALEVTITSMLLRSLGPEVSKPVASCFFTPWSWMKKGWTLGSCRHLQPLLPRFSRGGGWDAGGGMILPVSSLVSLCLCLHPGFVCPKVAWGPTRSQSVPRLVMFP